MKLALVAFLVRDYDEAIAWFTERLGFALIEDTLLGPDKRWVVVAPSQGGARLLLAKAATEAQRAAVGMQTGGRVGHFLETDDFSRDHAALTSRGVRFIEAPRREIYGDVAVFLDLYGGAWDLIQPAPA